MIARGLWPLQRGLAMRPVLSFALAGISVAVLALVWRPLASQWPSALAAAAAILVPVVLARGDGSRRRLAGRATGAAFVIAQPLILAGVLIDVRFLLPILAAGAFAVVIPTVMPMRADVASTELTAESRSTCWHCLIPPVALVALGIVMALRQGTRIAVPELDAQIIATVLGSVAISIGATMRPLFALGLAVAAAIALVVTASGAVSPMSIALGVTVALTAWFQRESSGGFPIWTPFVAAVATAAAFVSDPAWPAMAIMSGLAWLLAATYPVRASSAQPEVRSGAGVISWVSQLFVGLEPYWRFYARLKLVHDPLYARLAGEGRAWGSVLDAGCGPGLTAMVAVGRAGTTAYLGIDLDVDKLLVARRALRLSGREIGGTCGLRRECLPLANPPAERFDTVLVLDMLHYWPDTEQATTLTQLASLLTADGRLYLREGVAGDDGNAGEIERGERRTTYFGLNPENALTFLSAPRIAGLIAGAGLAVESEEPMGGENRLWVCRRSDAQCATTTS